MASQSQNSPAGTPDVSQKQLQDGCRADDLHALGMLSPADGVTDGSRFVRAGSGSEQFGNFEEHILGNATVALHHLGRIALEVALQHLENAPWVLQGRI